MLFPVIFYKGGHGGCLKRGFTLIETLIVMFLLLVLTANLFWMLVWGKTIWQSSLTRTANHQELRLSLHKIENELRDSDVDTITDNTSGSLSAFSFLSAFDVNGNFVTDSQGNPVWQKYVIVYIPSGSGKLFFKEVYGKYTSALPVKELTAYCDGSGKLLSPSISALKLAVNTGNKSVEFSLTINAVNQLGKTDEQTMDRTIFLRN